MVNGLAFSPNGRHVAAATGGIVFGEGSLGGVGGSPVLRIISTDDGAIVASFNGHVNGVKDVAFLSDDRVVSGSADGTIRVWTLEHALKGDS